MATSSLTALPVLRQKLRFAERVRQIMKREEHDILALAWPTALREKALEAASRLPAFQVVTAEDPKRDLYYLLPFDPSDAYALALQTALQMEMPIVFTGQDLEAESDETIYYADDEPLVKMGLDRFRKAWIAAEKRTKRELSEGDKRSAQTLREVAKNGKRILFVCEWYQWDGVAHALKHGRVPEGAPPEVPDLKLYRAHRASIKWISSEIPYLISRWVKHLESGSLENFDKAGALGDLVREAREHAGLSPDDAPIKMFSRRVGHLCGLRDRVMPSLAELMEAARETTHPGFSYQLYRLATRYFPQPKVSDLPTLELGAEFFGQRSHPLRPDGEGPGGPNRLRPLLHQLARFRRRRLPYLVPENAPPPSLRKRIRGILAHARLHGLPVPVADPILLVAVFAEGNDPAYPWRGAQASRQPRRGHILFCATHPISEDAFPGDARLKFGALAYSTASEPPVSPFLAPEPDTDLDMGGRLLMALARCHTPGPVLYLSARPPTEKSLTRVHQMGRRVLWVDMSALPRNMVAPLQYVHVLGFARGRRLIEAM